MTNNPSAIIEQTRDIDRWTGRVLRLGVWTSAALMTAGLLLAAIYSYRVELPTSAPTLPDIVKRLYSSTFDPITLMFAGLLVLMFTPILRVITALVGFAAERDRAFVVVSSIVLFLLAGEIGYSLMIR